MTIRDYFQELILPSFKGDYQDFSSKKVDGYSLFIFEAKSEERESMITHEVLERLQNILKIFITTTKHNEANLQKSQIARWYVNGFTSAYNYCRRYDLNHPHEQTNFFQWAQKLKSSDDLDSGRWKYGKFRNYTINLGRLEGALFYVAERGCPDDKKTVPLEAKSILVQKHVIFYEDRRTFDEDNSTSETNTCNSEGSKNTCEDRDSLQTGNPPKKDSKYVFPDGLIQELYNNYNEQIFKKIDSLEEFTNILTRKPHSEKLSACALKKMQMYKLLHGLYNILPESGRKKWLEDIAEESKLEAKNIEKKHNGSDSNSKVYKRTMGYLDEILKKYR
jgi:hypothetical protein